MKNCCYALRGEIFAAPGFQFSGVALDLRGWGSDARRVFSSSEQNNIGYGESYGNFYGAGATQYSEFSDSTRVPVENFSSVDFFGDAFNSAEYLGLLPLGNCQATINIKETSYNIAVNNYSLKNTCGNFVESVSIDISAHCVNKHVLDIAFGEPSSTQGDEAELLQETVWKGISKIEIGQSFAVSKGNAAEIISFANIVYTTNAVIEYPMVHGVDFYFNGNALVMLKPLSRNLRKLVVKYKTKSIDLRTIYHSTLSQRLYCLVFQGTNIFNGESVTFVAPRVSFKKIKNLALIDENTKTLDISADLLKMKKGEERAYFARMYSNPQSGPARQLFTY